MDQVLDHVLSYLDHHLDDRICYHTAAHTRDVYEAVGRIMVHEKVSDEEERLLLIAAAYHDIGYCSRYEQHEEASIQLFKQQMSQMSSDEINRVEQLIWATKINHKPQNLLEMIIRDADLDYLGRIDFQILSPRLYDELLAFGKVKDREEWKKMQIDFMTWHDYHTTYGQTYRTKRKQMNLEWIQKNP